MASGMSGESLPTRVRVKICGIINWADARLAVDLGVDALGFNFYAASPRSVSPAAAWDIIRRLPPFVAAVGVFVDWPADVVTALADALRFDAVQLHGRETPAIARDIAAKHKVIKAFSIGPAFRPSDLVRYSAASAFLLDGFKQGLHGGTGQTADWSVARKANRYGRVILAGGIKPSNVAQAITEAQPWAVDVASGVEKRPGKKDAGALRELMREIGSI
jgi:phosphoribosylanthranilate isomerase